MLTNQELTALAASIEADPALLGTIRARATPLLQRDPVVPRVKALLSQDGGVCPEDRTPLRFDPWSPEEHRCSRCGKSYGGPRHHRHWARGQHLWLAERMAELALLGAVTDDQGAVDRALALYRIYEDLYFDLPNRDNVLGPTHLFFSTYLESVWITNYLAGAFILRERELLPEERLEGINRVADEAALLIADFNEGDSNRQTWHAAALTALAAWFGDEELARTAVESRTGLIGHLTEGFGNDGAWWEGENYHLFALRGLMQGIHWGHPAGYHLLEDAELRDQFRRALLAPARSALPDFTYPARRDSRFGVSLTEQPSLELWEIGRAWLGPDEALDGWLAALYSLPEVRTNRLLYDAWLHDAGREAPTRADRGSLSWWTLAVQPPPLPDPAPTWSPESVLLPDQGLAVLVAGDRYLSLECGRDIGGHGHPDRLHLTLHAHGVHWLPDMGTGSYVERELFWYRSALAHNAPLVDGVNAAGADARCEAWTADGDYGWVKSRAGALVRTTTAGPTHLVDQLRLEPGPSRRLTLPWHLAGEVSVATPGRWEKASADVGEFATQPERFIPQDQGPVILSARAGEAGVRLFLPGGVPLLRATAPWLPGSGEERPFYFLEAEITEGSWTTVLDLAPPISARAVKYVEADGDLVTVVMEGERALYRESPQGMTVEDGGASRVLAGIRPVLRPHKPLLTPRLNVEPGQAPRIADPPALDGSLDGFDLSAPLLLDGEHQFRRSEEPYAPEQFRAEAWVNWNGESLFVAAAVEKPELVPWDPAAPARALDNEAEDLNADGVQLYLRREGTTLGILVAPLANGTLHTRTLSGSDVTEVPVEGGWAATESGYLLTFRVSGLDLHFAHPGERLGFDLLVNQMESDRERRSGQLAWHGAPGWVYLRGDRHEASDFGQLELG